MKSIIISPKNPFPWLDRSRSSIIWVEFYTDIIKFFNDIIHYNRLFPMKPQCELQHGDNNKRIDKKETYSSKNV